ncbi:MAG: GMC family oxidoreductase N-terminal domain-containing protein [Aeromicrobium sp.]|uniref:GMC family oxidoreductase n=1 Tax=Aeromicrobium sp. TaxID=1871063 RepID=UPI0039E54C29
MGHLHESFDYIVIGSGSAGGVVAARLSENPSLRVLLLEAGPMDDDDMIHLPAGFSTLFKTKWDWSYRTTGQKHLMGRRADWPRMKALGGCSSMNAMIYIRGNRADYDEWRDVYGGEGWGYDDVLPYFTKSEGNRRLGGQYHGTDGPLWVEDRRYNHDLTHAFVESAVAAGFTPTDDFNGAEQEGAGLYQVTCRKGRRWSIADAFIRPAMDRPNLTVRTEAFVTKIEIDGGRATGVTYRRHGAVETVRAEAEIVLSGGAVNSPQLLMLSGVGPGAQLREHSIEVKVDSPEVGRNLQDHPVAGVLLDTRDTTDLAEHLSFGNLLKAQKFGRGPLSSNVAESGAFFTSGDDQPAPDLQLHVLPTAFWDNGLHEPAKRGMVVASTLVRVESAGHVSLRSADPSIHPEIDPGYYTDPSDLDRMIVGVRRALEIASSGPLSRYIAAPWVPGSWEPTDDEIVAAVSRLTQTIYHPVGTCALGKVVDAQLRVQGVEGLRVADASVMPRVPRGNTNAPAIMVGEKAADLIKESR